MLFRSYVQRRDEAIARQVDLIKSDEQFDYGIDCLSGADRGDGDPLVTLRRYAQDCLAQSDAFFEPEPALDYRLSGDRLTFSSPVTTESKVNDIVSCRLFETPQKQRTRAVVILPHWNALPADYCGFGRWLLRSGITALRVSLPYHDARRPPAMRFAQYLVGPNLGRTIRSFRQAILDTRLAIRWLHDRGYTQIGVIGTSLGSSIGTIVAAKEARVAALACLMTASLVGEVVWTGRATRNIRRSLEGNITLPDLNDIWSIISPATYAPQLSTRRIPIQILSAREDRVFEPYLTQQIVDAYRAQGVPLQWTRLPCGHYTFGTFPFNVWVFSSVLRFLRRSLSTGTAAHLGFTAPAPPSARSGN
jgi:dienelactone hydrolase